MIRLTWQGKLIVVCTLGLAYPILLLIKPRRTDSPFKFTGEYLKDKR